MFGLAGGEIGFRVRPDRALVEAHGLVDYGAGAEQIRRDECGQTQNPSRRACVFILAAGGDCRAGRMEAEPTGPAKRNRATLPSRPFNVHSLPRPSSSTPCRRCRSRRLTLPLYIIVPTFYSESLGLPLASVGAALLAVRLADAVSDPLIGWVGDKWRPAHRAAQGAVHGLPIPICALAAIMLFWPPGDGGHRAMCSCGGWSCRSAIRRRSCPYQAWGAEMAGEYRERSRIACLQGGIHAARHACGDRAALCDRLRRSPASLHGLAVLGLTVAGLLFVTGAVTVTRVAEPRDHSKTSVGLAARDRGDGGQRTLPPLHRGVSLQRARQCRAGDAVPLFRFRPAGRAGNARARCCFSISPAVWPACRWRWRRRQSSASTGPGASR